MDKPVYYSHNDDHQPAGFCKYHVLRVRLCCGLSLVLDPTATSCGWKETIAPWVAYASHRVSQRSHTFFAAPGLLPPFETLELNPSNLDFSYETLVTELADVQESPDFDMSLEERLTETVVWGLFSRDRVENLLKLSNVDFLVKRATIVEAAKRALSFVVNEINNGARMLVSRTQIRLVDIVWCNEADYQAVVANRNNHAKVREVQKKWRARWKEAVGFKVAAEE